MNIPNLTPDGARALLAVIHGRPYTLEHLLDATASLNAALEAGEGEVVQTERATQGASGNASAPGDGEATTDDVAAMQPQQGRVHARGKGHVAPSPPERASDAPGSLDHLAYDDEVGFWCRVCRTTFGHDPEGPTPPAVSDTLERLDLCEPTPPAARDASAPEPDPAPLDVEECRTRVALLPDKHDRIAMNRALDELQRERVRREQAESDLSLERDEDSPRRQALTEEIILALGDGARSEIDLRESQLAQVEAELSRVRARAERAERESASAALNEARAHQNEVLCALGVEDIRAGSISASDLGEIVRNRLDAARRAAEETQRLLLDLVPLLTGLGYTIDEEAPFHVTPPIDPPDPLPEFDSYLVAVGSTAYHALLGDRQDAARARIQARAEGER